MFVNQECLVTLTKVSFCPIAFYLDRSSLRIKIQTIRAKKKQAQRLEKKSQEPDEL
jgi:tmRNA-binding protein